MIMGHTVSSISSYIDFSTMILSNYNLHGRLFPIVDEEREIQLQLEK